VDEALDAARRCSSGNAFGEAGAQIVVEEFLEGEELSVFALTDGTDALLMMPAQDHKRIGEGDTGPNTGGMGAYAPVSISDDALLDHVRTAASSCPTLAELHADGHPFRGLLYAGLMLTADGPQVIEFNARLRRPGDAGGAAAPEVVAARARPGHRPGDSIRGMELEWHRRRGRDHRARRRRLSRRCAAATRS
jgi:phosphoribosylamine-glycine ligase